MKKYVLSLAAASMLAIGVAASVTPAEARCGWNCGTAIGIGAFIGGAMIGSAMAGPPPGYAYYGYAPEPGYVSYSGYYGAAPTGCPGGHWARRPLYNQWGDQVGWSRPKFVCPY